MATLGELASTTIATANDQLPSFVVYDINSTTSTTSGLVFNNAAGFILGHNAGNSSTAVPGLNDGSTKQAGRKKRRRRVRSCKNKEEAESQRMTHIAVERNRRRQMNEHLAVLRSLMPESYVQRGDQASIVGGAIDFVKELEQLLQSLEAQKRTLQQEHQSKKNNKIGQQGFLPTELSMEDDQNDNSRDTVSCSDNGAPFAQFFSYPQYTWCHAPRSYPSMPVPECHRNAVADIEVTMVETHASLRVMSPHRPRQLLKMVAGLQSLRLIVLHINVTTLESIVLYSLSLKVEEGCSLTTVDDIAAAVHQILSLIEAEMLLLTQ